jgi:hypothetical protein
MDIEKLWEILHKERNTASLQELPEGKWMKGEGSLWKTR